MKIMSKNRTVLTGLAPTDGELLITKIARAKKNGEIIKDAAEIIYTPRKAGVIIGHDIHMDKWEIRAVSKMTLDIDKLNHREKLINPETGDDIPAA